MPLLSITTNISDTRSEQTLLRQASAEVAKMLGKPESYVMVKLEHNPHMLFAGSNAPLAYLELKSINLPAERTTELSQTLCSLMQATLAIDAERVYIEFANAERHMWGWNSVTF